MTLSHAVTCPRCAGKGYIENAVAECGDRTALCETCLGQGYVPTRRAAMYAYSMDKMCDLCGKLRGAAWDGGLFICVECWEGKYGN